jgi:drug/metabolite transporter (DMT)-like permease
VDAKAAPPDSATLAAFGVAVLIGGANFVAVKFSNEELDPLFGAALRFGLSAVLLFAMAAVMRWPLPRGRAAVGAALYGVLGFGLAYGLLYFALVGLAPGMSSTVTASVPLLTLALAVAHGQERFTLRRVVGGLLAVAGIGVLSLRAIGGDVEPLYFLSAVLGTMAVAESSVVIKGFPRAHPFVTNGVGMAVGAALLAVGSLLFGEQWALPATTRTWLALAWLVVAGSVAMFALFLFLIARWTASASVYVLTLMPIVAVTLGVLLTGEELSVELVVGGALVMLAVYVGALSQERPSSRGAPAPEPVPEAPGPGP